MKHSNANSRWKMYESELWVCSNKLACNSVISICNCLRKTKRLFIFAVVQEPPPINNNVLNRRQTKWKLLQKYYYSGTVRLGQHVSIRLEFWQFWLKSNSEWFTVQTYYLFYNECALLLKLEHRQMYDKPVGYGNVLTSRDSFSKGPEFSSRRS
jgi:hypothetical protein